MIVEVRPDLLAVHAAARPQPSTRPWARAPVAALKRAAWIAHWLVRGDEQEVGGRIGGRRFRRREPQRHHRERDSQPHSLRCVHVARCPGGRAWSTRTRGAVLLARPRLVRSRVASLRDEVFAEVVFGSEGIVGSAAESEVLRLMLAAARERFRVMELEPRRLSAALTGVASVRATPGVTREDGTPDRGGHVSTALARAFGRGRTRGLAFLRRIGPFWDSSWADASGSDLAAESERGRAVTAYFRRSSSVTRHRIARRCSSPRSARGAEGESKAFALSTSLAYSSLASNCTR
jgi:hypothetical protein